MTQPKPGRQVTEITGGSPDDSERIYPCARCGCLRTKAEGGTTFTVCDECWDAEKADADGQKEALG